MRGSIRILVGFMIALGAVGTIEVNPDADVFLQMIIAIVGLAVTLSGVSVIRENA